jgi:hypothetical protein
MDDKEAKQLKKWSLKQARELSLYIKDTQP